MSWPVAGPTDKRKSSRCWNISVLPIFSIRFHSLSERFSNSRRTFSTAGSILPVSFRHLNDVVIGSDSTIGEGFKQFGYGRKQRGRPQNPWTVIIRNCVTIEYGTDESCSAIDGKGADIFVEPVPVIALIEKVLLDIGNIERGHRRIMLLEILADARKPPG